MYNSTLVYFHLILKNLFCIGCKRILVTNDWYPTIQKPNVQLITDSIKEINEHGVATCNDKEYKVDTIVRSTGYNVHNYLIEFYDQKGIKLQDQ
ncbi:unnamed protein product [Didymodactylos carnosus]|uniref:Flavin-containing monooxygenase n=1 Tax=Didymodactylos carnosus TaxID=1234261 RepID=A0A814JQV3_9BILA|nr:unnamed protein product [Didymodactylos carnosus]CAF1074479.1 unnamed protein product [Didymodactylos carnosus]CAF3809469.1 unnamed protein product [Didymodactylos carnosus]CAF3838452.1 unnamed protein product [Didymodactylos carnosus]